VLINVSVQNELTFLRSSFYDLPHHYHFATLHSMPAAVGDPPAAASEAAAEAYLAFAAGDVIDVEASALAVLDLALDALGVDVAVHYFAGAWNLDDDFDLELADEAKGAAGAFLEMDADNE
jgi:hypothetical protein